MSDWKVVIPELTKNLITNPSFETGTTGWVTGGTNTIARDATQQYRGVYSCKVTYQDNATLASYAITLTATEYAFSVYLWIPTAYDGGGVSIQFANFAGITGGGPQAADLTKRDQWQLVEVAGTPAGGDLVGDLQAINTGAAPTAGRFLYVDAVQCELGGEATTRCDGDQPGCEWLGTPHASQSQRSALSRAGGVEQDLKDDLFFGVQIAQGWGMSGQDVNVDEFVIIDGGTLNSIKVLPRTEARLDGVIKDTSATCNLHAMRETLTRALSPRSYPDADGLPQAVRLVYTGADTPKFLPVHLESGLEGSITTEQKAANVENATLGFVSPQAFWDAVEDSGAALNTSQAVTVRLLAGRLRVTGEWSELGPPDVAGTYVNVSALLLDGQYLYIGGSFTNFDNLGVNANYIIRYDLITRTYSTIGAGATNSTVLDIIKGPDGTIYFCGNFTTIGGVAANRVASYNPTTDTFAALGAGFSTTVHRMYIGKDGTLYAGGNFHTGIGDVADRIAKFSAGAWVALPGGGTNASVFAIREDGRGQLYVGGGFTTVGPGPTPANRVAIYDLATDTYSAIGAGMNSAVNDFAINEPTNDVYMCGVFTTADGVSANRIALYNGVTFSPLGTGTDGEVRRILLAPDGALYATGFFNKAGDIAIAQKAAKWVVSTWAHLDLNLPGAANTEAIAIGPPDPVIERNYDVFLGFAATGSATWAASQTAANNGTAITYPVVTVKRTGGTSAVLKQIRNETTGRELLFNYSLLDGEELIIALPPTDNEGQSITSNYFGMRMDAILPNSDLGTFTLTPGDGGANVITSFVDVVGATIDATMQWKNRFEGFDG